MYADAGNGQLRLPYQHGGFDVTHRAGRLVIFPSHLYHEIFPYQGERPRIVIAFNCAVS
jgi:predicted 2-oxoglutarate/Fe(II)-dependent dioxygenase YbiX